MNESELRKRWDSGILEARTRVAAAARDAGRDSAAITLIAVSKHQPFAAIQYLYRQHGQRDFGENYAQELRGKALEAEASGLRDIRWHFIGQLQTNKVKFVAPHLTAIHTIDSLRLAEMLSKKICQSERARVPLDCFIEVNLDAQATKAGIVPTVDAVVELWQHMSKLPGLKPIGLMAIPDPNASDRPFERLARLASDAGTTITAPSLSIGMSADFGAAITAGSTHVRIGTTIFGPRPA